MRYALPLLALLGCGPPPDHLRRAGCPKPELWYEPADSADPSADDPDGVYLGCDPPPGWVHATD